MNKTIAINLGGMPFQIDEDAYNVLSRYLDAVRYQFQQLQGNDEIMEDIESRLAEMFNKDLKESGRKIVSLADVDSAIQVMGKPEDFDENLEGNQTYQTTENYSNSSRNTPRKLYRDPDNKIFGGVLSGLSYYLGLDNPNFLRILFASLPILDFFFIPGTITTFLIVIYIILWITVPVAKTPTEKMQMKGEAVNLNSIHKKINDGYNNVKKNLTDNDTLNEVTSKTSNFLENLIEIIGKIALYFGLAVSIMILLGSIIGFFGVALGTTTFAPFVAEKLFGHGLWTWIGMLGLLFIFIALPIFLIALFTRILFNSNVNVARIGFISLIMFLSGLLMSGASTAHFVSDFRVKETYIQTSNLSYGPQLTVLGNVDEDSNFFDFKSNEKFGSKMVDLHIKQSLDSTSYLEVKKSARGRNSIMAKLGAEETIYQYQLDDNRILFDETYSLTDKQLWRANKVDLYLYVPEGKTLLFDSSVEEILDDVNIGGEYFSSYEVISQKRWKIHENHFIAVDNEGNEIEPKKVDPSNESDKDSDSWEWDEKEFEDGFTKQYDKDGFLRRIVDSLTDGDWSNANISLQVSELGKNGEPIKARLRVNDKKFILEENSWKEINR